MKEDNMKCGHCKQEGVDVTHVKTCAGLVDALAAHGRTLVAPREELRHSSDGDAIAVITAPRVEDGYYTVVYDEERDDRVTIRVRPHWEDEKAARGERVLDYLSGSDNTRDYQGFAFVGANGELRVWKRYSHNDRLRRAWNVVVENPEETGMAYALHSGNCRRCGRVLTVPASIHRGMGPVCAGVA